MIFRLTREYHTDTDYTRAVSGDFRPLVSETPSSMDKITSPAWYLEPSKETERQLEAIKLPF